MAYVQKKCKLRLLWHKLLAARSFNDKLNVSFKKRSVQNYVWSTALHQAETWTAGGKLFGKL